MNKTFLSLSQMVFCLLVGGCSIAPVTVTPIKTYTLSDLNPPAPNINKLNASLTVMPVSAVSGFDTSDMVYETKPYLLSSFAENAWIAPPAALITPLLTQALQESGHFTSVVAGPALSNTDYILSTTLVSLYQNFTVQPSTIVLNLDLNLVSNKTNQVIADKILHFEVKTQEDTPYGGVMAANAALSNAIPVITQFLVSAISTDLAKSATQRSAS